MAAKRGGLGKGLDSLIPEVKTKPVSNSSKSAEKETKTLEQLVKISKIEPNREQPRKNFAEKERIIKTARAELIFITLYFKKITAKDNFTFSGD